MMREWQIPLFDLVFGLSNAIDLVSPVFFTHHKRTAFIAGRIAEEMALPPGECNRLVLAGLLHDCGALSLKERLELLPFEEKSTNKHRHGETGYRLLNHFVPLPAIAALVRHHHVDWRDGAGWEHAGQPVDPGCHTLHLADRVAVLVNDSQPILGQVTAITELIGSHARREFTPESVAALGRLAGRESFWLDIVNPAIVSLLRERSGIETMKIDIAGLLDLSRLFCQIIDFRSRFTATHSNGVGAVAESLARIHSFSAADCLMLKVAGFLHDLGKLAVPVELLEKPGPLSNEEWHIMRSHTYHTYHLLDAISALKTIKEWAAFHHERLDGSGYPFHRTDNELTLGAKLIAVADIFTALAEERPYRQALAGDEVLRIFRDLAAKGVLPGVLVDSVADNFEEINACRASAQTAADIAYAEFGR